MSTQITTGSAQETHHRMRMPLVAFVVVAVAVVVAISAYALVAWSPGSTAGSSAAGVAAAPSTFDASASLPGAARARLDRYGLALTAGAFADDLRSASLPGATKLELRRYGRSLAAAPRAASGRRGR